MQPNLLSGNGKPLDPFVAGIIRVVFTDYNNALLYECGMLTANGTCESGQASVEAWSRTPEPVSQHLKNAYIKRFAELCIDRENVEDVPHNG